MSSLFSEQMESTCTRGAEGRKHARILTQSPCMLTDIFYLCIYQARCTLIFGFACLILVFDSKDGKHIERVLMTSEVL